MNIEEMTMDEIQERMKAINEELKGECDIDALTAEFDALEKEIAEAAVASVDAVTHAEKGTSETKVYEASSFVDYLVEETGDEKTEAKPLSDSDTGFSVEINN